MHKIVVSKYIMQSSTDKDKTKIFLLIKKKKTKQKENNVFFFNTRPS